MTCLSSYTKRNEFNEILFSVIDQFLQEKDAHPTDVVLGINRKTKLTKIGTKAEFTSAWDLYPMAKLIRRNDDNSSEEVDIDVTFEIASSFYFVR